MTVRSLAFAVTCTSLFLFAAGCRSPHEGRAEQAPKPAAASVRQPLDVLIEEGRPSEMEARQYGYRLELRDAMERDLPRRLARYGFDARMIRQRSEHGGPAGGRHLLVVHYDAYNPGSAGARIAVGFGAGAASLDMSMTLHQGGAPVLSWKDGCGTSGHWSRIINKLDDNMGKKLQAFYQKR
jgi:hypothetical protein